MKKIPIVLSSAAILVSGAVTVPAMGLDLKTNLTNLNDNNLTLLNAGEITGPESLPVNYYPSGNMLRFTAFDLNRSTIRLRNNAINGAMLMKLVVAYRNYEDGVTEDEAERGALTLGVDDISEWGILAFNLEYPEGENGTILGGIASVKGVRLDDNLTDVIYYAALYANKVVDDDGGYHFENERWERGKVDYRDCIHSSVFKRESMTCKISSTTDEAVSYVPSGASLPEGEVVIDWDTEWREAQKKTLDDTIKELSLLDQKLDKADTILDDADKTLTRLLKTMPQSGGLDIEVARAQEWQKAVQLIRNMLVMGKADTGNDGEVEQLQQRVKDLLQTVQELSDKNQSLSITNENLIDENRNLTSANQELTGKNQDLVDKNQSLTNEKQELVDKKQNLTLENGELSESHHELAMQLEQARLENSILKTEMEELKKKLSDMEGSTIGGAMDNADSERMALLQRIEQLSADKDALGKKNQELMNKIQELEVEQHTVVMASCESEGIAQQGISTNGDGVLNSDQQSVAESGEKAMTSEQEDMVAVPNLGEIKQNNYWWLIIPVIGVLIGVIWWLKRVFSSQRP